jgi:predicted phage terminase large subunit-like protein
MEIRLQPKQELWSSSPADIAIMGGAAGGGKTFGLIVEPMRYIRTVQGFGAVIFRRTYPEITNMGGLWDEAYDIYTACGAVPNRTRLELAFKNGNYIRFSHLQFDTDVLDWKGAQIPLIEFDQLETFTEAQFFYLVSRNRSMCGVRPYIRASANPEPGWLAEFLSWWISPDGYANMDRIGKIRWFVRPGDDLVWADTKEELLEKYPKLIAKSVTFIPSTIYDNQKLLEKDPDYLANLMALPMVERERLLGDPNRGGNWKIKPSAGNIFNKEWFKTVDNLPVKGVECRYWDFAATEKKYHKDDPDFTAGVSVRKVNGMYYISDVISRQMAPKELDELFYNTTVSDMRRCADSATRYMVRWEEEPGSASIRETRRLVSLLAGVDAGGIRVTGDKITRWMPLSAQSQVGNVKLLKAPWNDEWLYHMHGQPDLEHDDIADASAGAYTEICLPRGAELVAFIRQKEDQDGSY